MVKIVEMDEELIKNIPNVIELLYELYGAKSIGLFAVMVDEQLCFIGRYGADCVYIHKDGYNRFTLNENEELGALDLDDFEVFKSNVGHELQELGQLSFLEKYLMSDDIELLWKYNKLNAMYLIAMIDYVSRINGISLCSKYDKYRSYKLKEEIYPSSYYAHKKVVSTYKMENIIAEFERFGIIEGDVFNVQ